MFFAREPLLQQLNSWVIWIYISYELLKALNVLLQILPIKVVLASANQEHVFDCFYFFIGKLARGAPRKLFELFLHNVDFFVTLLNKFEIGL